MAHYYINITKAAQTHRSNQMLDIRNIVYISAISVLQTRKFLLKGVVVGLLARCGLWSCPVIEETKQCGFQSTFIDQW